MTEVQNHELKILHVLVALPRGGKERLVADACQYGPSVDIRSSVFALSGGNFREDLESTDVDVFVGNRKWAIDVSALCRLRKIIKTHDIDAVHAHEPVEGIYGYLASRYFPVATVLSVHGHLTGIKNRTAFRFLRHTVDAIVPVSRSCMEEAGLGSQNGRGPRVTVLYNGIDLKRFAGANQKLRAEIGIRDRELLAGMIAHFMPGKDPLTVARALEGVLSRMPDVHFVFVGRREERFAAIYDTCIRYCRSLHVSDRIHFIGQRSDIPEILASLDLMVLSSTSETFGLAAVEGMAMGVPIILSAIPAFLEVTSQGQHAFVFPPGDHRELERIMLEVLTNHGLRYSRVPGARRWVFEHFGLPRHLQGLREIYLMAISDRAGRRKFR